LSIKQAAEGGVVSAEYQEHFGEHAYDDEGNFIGGETTEAQEAWAEYYAEHPEELAGEAAAAGEVAGEEPGDEPGDEPAVEPAAEPAEG
jgi:small subunit ribosomal protein S1